MLLWRVLLPPASFAFICDSGNENWIKSKSTKINETISELFRSPTTDNAKWEIGTAAAHPRGCRLLNKYQFSHFSRGLQGSSQQPAISFCKYTSHSAVNRGTVRAHGWTRFGSVGSRKLHSSASYESHMTAAVPLTGSTVRCERQQHFSAWMNSSQTAESHLL